MAVCGLVFDETTKSIGLTRGAAATNLQLHAEARHGIIGPSIRVRAAPVARLSLAANIEHERGRPLGECRAGVAAGPVMAPADILAVVEDQFYDVRKRLDAQLTRTAEIQQQLEGQRKEIAELRRTVNLAHGLLKELLAKSP